MIHVDQLLGHIEAMRNAKHEVDRCERFLNDANVELTDALLRMETSRQAYLMWCKENEVPVP